MVSGNYTITYLQQQLKPVWRYDDENHIYY